MTPKQIYNLRRDLHMNQRVFGSELGVRGWTVSRWELGKQTPTNDHIACMRTIAETHGIKILEA